MNGITLSQKEVERIAYALKNRSLPRAITELIVASTLKLDPEAGPAGIPAPHRMHLFTTCKRQDNPFPAIIELGVRGWLVSDPHDGDRLAYPEEVEAFLAMRKGRNIDEDVDQEIGKPRKKSRPSRYMPSEGNANEV